jgi:hypothetical protein
MFKTKNCCNWGYCLFPALSPKVVLFLSPPFIRGLSATSLETAENPLQDAFLSDFYAVGCQPFAFDQCSLRQSLIFLIFLIYFDLKVPRLFLLYCHLVNSLEDFSTQLNTSSFSQSRIVPKAASFEAWNYGKIASKSIAIQQRLCGPSNPRHI